MEPVIYSHFLINYKLNKLQMKTILLLFFTFLITITNAQDAIKKVIVETYYISDAIDSTNLKGGELEMGSATYRVYIQMKPGCKLSKIYGDDQHALKFKSTTPFFNNTYKGQSFAKDFSKADYGKNTIALDTWLTIGQTTKTESNVTYFGVLKSEDRNGSFIGGANNIAAGGKGGLLTNNNPNAGIPLTQADGMDTLMKAPSNWQSNGFTDSISQEDSTIFGSTKVGTEFVSNNAFLQNSGVMGIVADSNQVLVAQLTTKGEISFELNVDIIEANGTTTHYVAKGTNSDDDNTKVCPSLKYPAECGCKDKGYFEYNGSLTCENKDSCKTPIVFGCMDPAACNYDPKANVNMQSLCCYPGMCADRDISLVCPTLGKKLVSMTLYPNPAQDKISIEALSLDNSETRIVVYNSFGNIELEKNIGLFTGNLYQEIPVSNLKSGIYMVRLYLGNEMINKTFIKN